MKFTTDLLSKFQTDKIEVHLICRYKFGDSSIQVSCLSIQGFVCVGFVSIWNREVWALLQKLSLVKLAAPEFFEMNFYYL